MENLFLKKLVEGYSEGIYIIDINRKQCDYEGRLSFLTIFDKNKKKLLDVRVTERESEMLLFLMQHEDKMKELCSKIIEIR